MTIYGYVCGNAESDKNIQESALKSFGCEKIISDRCHQRSERDALIKSLKPGDKMIVWRLDKFADNVRYLSDLFLMLKDNSIDFKTLQEDLGSDQIDDEFQALIEQMAVIEENIKD